MNLLFASLIIVSPWSCAAEEFAQDLEDVSPSVDALTYDNSGIVSVLQDSQPVDNILLNDIESSDDHSDERRRLPGPLVPLGAAVMADLAPLSIIFSAEGLTGLMTFSAVRTAAVHAGTFAAKTLAWTAFIATLHCHFGESLQGLRLKNPISGDLAGIPSEDGKRLWEDGCTTNKWVEDFVSDLLIGAVITGGFSTLAGIRSSRTGQALWSMIGPGTYRATIAGREMVATAVQTDSSMFSYARDFGTQMTDLHVQNVDSLITTASNGEVNFAAASPEIAEMITTLSDMQNAPQVVGNAMHGIPSIMTVHSAGQASEGLTVFSMRRLHQVTDVQVEEVDGQWQTVGETSCSGMRCGQYMNLPRPCPGRPWRMCPQRHCLFQVPCDSPGFNAGRRTLQEEEPLANVNRLLKKALIN